MKRTIREYINDTKEKGGLLLIDLPTGYGKTYISVQSIYEYIIKKEGKKKIFFITNLNNNLPNKELEQVYKKDGKLNQFKKDVLVIKSNYNFVYDKLLELQIPEKYHTDAYHTLKEKLIQIKQLKDRNYIFLSPFIEHLEREIREKYEKAFRRDIQAIIKNEMSKNKMARRNLIRNQDNYRWIGELYPTVFMDEYKVYIFTMSKFLVKNTTLIEPSYEFLKNKIIDNAIFFIDEFDTTKEVIQNSIIERALDSQDDYIQLFEQIYKTMQVHEFPYSMIQPYYESIKGKKTELTIENLLKDAHKIYETFYLKYSYKTFSQEIDRKQSFLFNDGLYHTISRNNYNYIRTTPNEEEKQVQIFFENRDTYYQNKKDSDIIIYRMIRAINSFLNKFKNMVFNWANQYAIEINRIREEEEDEFTIENAINSIYREFSLSDLQKQLVTSVICSNEAEHDDVLGRLLNTSFYKNGFQYFEFVDADEHLSKTIFHYAQIKDTPEEIMLYLSKKAKVIGLSATASLESVVGNYDIGYLKKELGEKFHQVSSKVYDSIKKDLEKRWNAYTNGQVKIELSVVDQNKGNILLKDRLKELLKNRDLIEKYNTELSNRAKGREYIWQRYCNIFYILKQFLKTEGINSFLCLNMVLPEENKASFDLKLFQDFCMDLKKLYVIDANIELVVLKSNNFDCCKEEALNQLSQGKKLFIFSSYKTIGAGQNMQYKIPEGEKVLCIYDTKVKQDSRAKMKDMDALYLGDITNLISNTYDKEKFGKMELLRFFFEVEYLYQNDEISYKTLEDLIKLGFKSYSNSQEWDALANRKQRETMSVRRKATRDVVQAIGRICRTYNKKERVYLFTTEQLLSKIDVTCLEGKIVSPEVQAIVNCKNKMKSLYTDEEEILLNEAERISSRGKTDIMRILSRDWNFVSMRLWKELRNCVLKYPTANRKEIEDKEYQKLIDSLYIKNKGKNSIYLFAQKGDFSDVVIDYNNDKITFQNSDKCHNKRVSIVSEKESRLQEILKYPGMREYFKEHNWAESFKEEELIMSPILFQNIYKGALGEVAGKFILEKELGIKLSEITEPDKFEFFDFKIAEGIYIDFKHWKYGYLDDRETKKAEIRNKLKKINGKKVYIINIISDTEFGRHKQNDGKIVEIPNLIHSKGTINKKIIQYLQGEIHNDLMQQTENEVE